MSNDNTVHFNMTADSTGVEDACTRTMKGLRAMGLSAEDAKKAFDKWGTAAVRARQLADEYSSAKMEREIDKLQKAMNLTRTDAQLLNAVLVIASSKNWMSRLIAAGR